MAIEIKFAAAVRIGADMKDETAMLDKIVDLIKRGEFTVAPELLAKCADTTDAKLRSPSRKRWTRARPSERVQRLHGHGQRGGHAGAGQGRDGKKEFVNAFDLVAESAESLKRDEKQALENRMGEARTMLAILKELNCESITLKDKMAKAEEMKGKNNTMQALRTANDVIQFSHSIMLDEFTREMASTSRAISLERKKGSRS